MASFAIHAVDTPYQFKIASQLVSYMVITAHDAPNAIKYGALLCHNLIRYVY